jgi:hypothetical protein
MQRSFKTLLTVLPLLFAQHAMAQSTCADYHKFNCMRSTDARFSVNGQSKSASVQVGKETELNIIIHRGQDYRISVCNDQPILGEQLSIRLVEKIRVPRDPNGSTSSTENVVDADGTTIGTSRSIRTRENERAYDEIEKVLWDNADHDMTHEIEFSCTATKRIAIEINAPGGDGPKKKNAQHFDIGCVGILIEHMTSPPLGF